MSEWTQDQVDTLVSMRICRVPFSIICNVVDKSADECESKYYETTNYMRESSDGLNRRWTSRDISNLVSLYNQDFTVAEIAIRMKRTSLAVAKKLNDVRDMLGKSERSFSRFAKEPPKHIVYQSTGEPSFSIYIEYICTTKSRTTDMAVYHIHGCSSKITFTPSQMRDLLNSGRGMEVSEDEYIRAEQRNDLWDSAKSKAVRQRSGASVHVDECGAKKRTNKRGGMHYKLSSKSVKPKP